jgi:hypothetical protein
MGELVIPFGLLERSLPSFDTDAFARALAPVLDAGDTATATRLWLSWRERADRVLRRKKVPAQVREALLRELSSAVRLNLYLYRKPTTSRPVAKAKAKAKAAPSAAVIQFRARGSAA